MSLRSCALLLCFWLVGACGNAQLLPWTDEKAVDDDVADGERTLQRAPVAPTPPKVSPPSPPVEAPPVVPANEAPSSVPLDPQIPGVRVDLRAYQTPIRDQGARGTCIVFAATAALESAYKRAGYGDIDLSEEMTNHLGKTFWLHPNWDEIATEGAAYNELQVALYGGGNGAGYVRALHTGQRTVREQLMPYLFDGEDEQLFPEASEPWTSPRWRSALSANDYNLHPRSLWVSALTAPQSYGVAAWHLIDIHDAAAVEAELDQGHSIVWDVTVQDTEGPIWRTCREKSPCGVVGDHSMLIVGYDKSASDPSEHYFIVKNSWGRAATSDTRGFTHVSYDYLADSFSGAVIDAVTTPRPWRSAGFVGRWVLNAGDVQGFLDIYHLPGASQAVFDENGNGLRDRRLGLLYTASGAYRVNAALNGDELTFYYKPSTPNLRWDVLQGVRVDVTLANDALTMSGTLIKENGASAAASLRRVTNGDEFRGLSAAQRQIQPSN